MQPAHRVFLLKPYGKPCSIWFTMNTLVIEPDGEVSSILSNDKRLRVYIVENLRLNRRNPPVLHEVQCVNINDSICSQGDTLMFGYWNLKNDIFVAQNCISYAGNSYEGTPIHHQLNALHNVFENHVISRTIPSVNTHKMCSLFVPFMFRSLEDSKSFIRNHASVKCGYDIYSIVQLSDTQPRYIEEKLFTSSNRTTNIVNNRSETHRSETQITQKPQRPINSILSRSYGTPPPQPYRQRTTERRVFRVSCTPTADLYELYDVKPPHTYIGNPMVTDYKMSKYMNKMFHNIRENDNIDLIEESDDEDDFENIRDDRWVANRGFVEIEFIMHPRFHKWVPVIPEDHNHIKCSREHASDLSSKRGRANRSEMIEASAV